MLDTLAVDSYRSLHALVVPLAPLTVVTGANGVGKSNLYGALRLLARVAGGEAISALAREGGLPNVMWAGPDTVSRAMERGEVAVQGGPRARPARLRLGFVGEDLGYLVELGMPVPSSSAFDLDPVIKRECIWGGALYRPAAALVDRSGPVLRRRSGRRWTTVSTALAAHDSLFDSAGDADAVPEVFRLRETMRHWRFYADFRTDADAPARRSIPATRTPVLHHDGRDLAAALQTIIEVGDRTALDEAIDDALPAIRAAAGERSLVWTWRDSAGGFLRALEVEDTVMFVLMSVLVLIASMNIISGLVMLVKNKGRDIGILRTMGLTEGAVMRVFFLCGAFVGTLGTIFGVIIGCLFAIYFDQILALVNGASGGGVWEASVRGIYRLPAELQAGDVLSAVSLSLLLSWGITLFPARRAARMNPVEALRYE